MKFKPIPSYEGLNSFSYVYYCNEDENIVVPILTRLYNEGFKFCHSHLPNGSADQLYITKRMAVCSMIVVFLSESFHADVRSSGKEALSILKSNCFKIFVRLDRSSLKKEWGQSKTSKIINYVRSNEAAFWLKLYDDDILEKCRGAWPDKPIVHEQEQEDDSSADSFDSSDVHSEYSSLLSIMRAEGEQYSGVEEEYHALIDMAETPAPTVRAAIDDADAEETISLGGYTPTQEEYSALEKLHHHANRIKNLNSENETGTTENSDEEFDGLVSLLNELGDSTRKRAEYVKLQLEGGYTPEPPPIFSSPNGQDGAEFDLPETPSFSLDDENAVYVNKTINELFPHAYNQPTANAEEIASGAGAATSKLSEEEKPSQTEEAMQFEETTQTEKSQQTEEISQLEDGEELEFFSTKQSAAPDLPALGSQAMEMEMPPAFAENFSYDSQVEETEAAYTEFSDNENQIDLLSTEEADLPALPQTDTVEVNKLLADTEAAEDAVIKERGVKTTRESSYQSDTLNSLYIDELYGTGHNETHRVALKRALIHAAEKVSGHSIKITPVRRTLLVKKQGVNTESNNSSRENIAVLKAETAKYKQVKIRRQASAAVEKTAAEGDSVRGIIVASVSPLAVSKAAETTYPTAPERPAVKLSAVKKRREDGGNYDTSHEDGSQREELTSEPIIASSDDSEREAQNKSVRKSKFPHKSGGLRRLLGRMINNQGDNAPSAEATIDKSE
ncbi:MAG: hypothetical protein LBL82_01960 [Oscillospiraceae bacterium]|nr:hypothetical protein [Oscillospiraceae bacterium]